MIHLRTVLSFCLLLFVAGCGSKAATLANSSAGLASVDHQLRGIAFGSWPLADSTVTCEPLRPRQTGKSQPPNGAQLVAVQADSKGFFAFESITFDYPHLITAKGLGQQHPYRAYVMGPSDPGPSITPLTTLSTALADHLTQTKGTPLAAAYEAAEEAIREHFLVQKPSLLVPVDLTSTTASDLPAYFRADTQMTLRLRALELVAENYANNEAQLRREPAGDLSLATLTDVLSQDVRADGLFDGIGADRQQLHIGTQSYTDDILHLEFAKELRNITERLYDKILTSTADVCATARKIAKSNSPHFPNQSAAPEFLCQQDSIRIRGSVTPIRPSEIWQVNVYTANSQGRKGSLLGSTEADDTGYWEAAIEGDQPLFIEATSTSRPGIHLRSILPNVPDEGIHIHPFTSIGAAYALRLVDDGKAPSQAFNLATSFLRDSFGYFATGKIRPKETNLSIRIGSGEKLHPAEKISILIDALSHLSKKNLSDGSDNGSLFLLVDLLAQDIQSRSHDLSRCSRRLERLI